MDLLKAQEIVLSELSNLYNVKVYKEVRKGVDKLFKVVKKEQLSIHGVSFSKPTYKDKNQLPDDIKYLFHKGVDLYQTIMDYERGIIGPEEFIAEMRKVDKAY